MIEYPNPKQRGPDVAKSSPGSRPRFYLEVGTERCVGQSDVRAVDPTRTTAVHYLTFELPIAVADAIRGGALVSVGVDHDALTVRTTLSAALSASLSDDLSQ